KPVTLSLRLFGNIFAGAVMIGLISSIGLLYLPAVQNVPTVAVAAVLLAIWKAFDVIFIGFIQAFIFMLLTVIYFGMGREGLEHEPHETTQETTGRMLTPIQEGSHD